METKLEEWMAFSAAVADHIADYCIPQYGDYPDELIDSWTVAHIKSELATYIKRIGTDLRGRKESERDALKIAHYACYLLKFLREE